MGSLDLGRTSSSRSGMGVAISPGTRKGTLSSSSLPTHDANSTTWSSPHPSGSRSTGSCLSGGGPTFWVARDSADEQGTLCGPPGCGKSVAAEALARDLYLPLATVRFDAVVSSYLGETAANLRKVFEFGRSRPLVLLFDEFDAIGKERTAADDTAS